MFSSSDDCQKVDVLQILRWISCLDAKHLSISNKQFKIFINLIFKPTGYMIYGGGLIFALPSLCLLERSCEHYEHLTSMLKPYEGIVSESSIAGFLYYCHNHLRVARVRGCRADWAHISSPWLSHDWAARHRQSVQGSQSHTLRLIGCSLRMQPFTWLIDCRNAMK